MTSSAATPGSTEPSPTGAAPEPWWRNAVFYQLHPRSFADSNGDGIGDLGGVRDKLGYLELLGITAVWLSPLTREPTPGAASDPRGVDPAIGSLEVVDALIAEAHSRSIRVTMDLAPHHLETARTLRFWLDRGIDGFHTGEAAVIDGGTRRVIDEHPGAVLVGSTAALVETTFEALALQAAVDTSFAAVTAGGATPTWTLSNRDAVREVTRYGDGEVGLARARAMALVVLGLPGAASLYNGSELGLPDVELPDRAQSDPASERTGCRVPLPWEGRTPPFGFGAAPTTWLPIPPEWADRTVESQLEDVGSILNLYRAAIEMRTHRPEFGSTGLDWYGSPPGCLAYRTRGGLICALNTTDRPIALPPGAVLLASSPVIGGQLGGNSSAWMV